MGTPIRIALIRQRYTPFGGAERFVENALNALQKKSGVELTLITRTWDGADNPDVKKIICDPFYIGRLWRDWSFARCACRTVKNNDFDLVQSHERVPCGDIYRAGDGIHRQWLHQRALPNPWWKNVWSWISPYHRYLLWQERRTLTQHGLQSVIVNSKLIKDEIYKWFPQTVAQIKIIHNSVDTKYFHPKLRDKYRTKIREQLRIDDSIRLLLFVGSGFERKGVPLLLKVLSKLNDVHLVVVGRDRHTKRYQHHTEQLGIDNRIHFVGPQQDPRPWYGAADIFVFPTLYDPLPNTVLEAMACGLPVVVSSSCGAIDLIENGEQGFIINPLDPNDWADKINHYLDLVIQMKMGQQARITVEKLTPEAMSTRLISIYQSIIATQ